MYLAKYFTHKNYFIFKSTSNSSNEGVVLALGIVPFALEKIWGYYSKKRQDKIDLTRLKEQVCRDLGFNAWSGIGSQSSPFQLSSLEELLRLTHDEDLKNEIGYIIQHARLCNAYGGLRHLAVPPGQVKILCSELKNRISS